jgi:predicted TIM-barrel fold metal-dependent hydrolase
MYKGPIIDIHAHIRLAEDTPINGVHEVGVKGLVRAVRVDRVQRATAIVVAVRGDPATPARNDAVLAAAGGSTGFLIPVVSVHPHDGRAAIEELDRVAAAGAPILKLHPTSQRFDVADGAVEAVVRRAGEHGMIVLFDCWSPYDTNQPGKLLRLTRSCPDTRLILAHLNGPRFPELLVFDVAARDPGWPGTVYFDLSATVDLLAGGPYMEHLCWVMRKLGIDRIMYGSDWPQCDPSAALAAVRELDLTDDEQRRVLYANAANLLGL